MVVTIRGSSFSYLPPLPLFSNADLAAAPQLYSLYLERGLSFTDAHGNTLLHLAVLEKNDKWVKFLLEQGLDPTVQNCVGDTPLHLATAIFCNESLTLMIDKLKRASSDFSYYNNTGNTPLCVAAICGNVFAARKLVSAGAPVDGRNCLNTLTPFQLATLNQRIETLEVLLELGADVNAQDYKGNSPLHYCCMFGYEETALLLMRHDARMFSNSWGDCPIHVAAFMGNSKIMRIFIDNGADLELKNRNLLTPIHISAMLGHEQTMEDLLKCHVSVIERDNNGNTSLHAAACFGHTRCAVRLAGLFPDLDIKNIHDDTPIMTAIREGRTETAKALLDLIRLVDAPDIGKKLLQCAIAFGNFEIVKDLIERDPSLRHSLMDGSLMPYAFAKVNGREEIAAFLGEDDFSAVYLTLKQLAHVSGLSGDVTFGPHTFPLERYYQNPIRELADDLIPAHFDDVRDALKKSLNTFHNLNEVIHSIKSGALTIINCAWKDHLLNIVIKGPVMIICNRGARRPTDPIFKTIIIDPAKFTTTILMMLRNAELTTERAQELYYDHLPQWLSPTGFPIDSSNNLFCRATQVHLFAKDQKKRNCSAANIKAAIRAALFLSLVSRKAAPITPLDFLIVRCASKVINARLRIKAENKCAELLIAKPHLEPTVMPYILSSLYKRAVKYQRAIAVFNHLQLLSRAHLVTAS